MNGFVEMVVPKFVSGIRTYDVPDFSSRDCDTGLHSRINLFCIFIIVLIESAKLIFLI